MKKNLTEGQKIKGAKYIENEKRRIRKQYQHIMSFKIITVSYLQLVSELRSELNEMKLYLAELERKYI